MKTRYEDRRATHRDLTAENILPKLLELARSAGEILLSTKSGLTRVQTKSDGSPVTEADMKADDFFRDGLRKIGNAVPIVSEESSMPAYSLRKTWKEFWLVDALDGTKEYIAGRDEYTVNVALLRDGIPHVGVVYAPAKRTLYYATLDSGSWRLDESGSAPMRIFSTPPSQGKLLTVVESRSHPSPEMDEFLRTVRIRERIKMGSSLKFCLLAEGKADVYPRFGPTMEWDVAAGDCIFRYSGRESPRRSPFRYNKEEMRNDPFVIGLDP